MSQIDRDLAALMGRPIYRRGALSMLAAGIGGAALAACEGRAAAGGADGQCLMTPAETKGPFPADGSGRGAINILDVEGVVRRDIRTSFAGMAGRADGVPLELELQLADAGEGCAPLPGHAIYLWQNDAAGHYSLYNLPDENYLRGLQAADERGMVRFTGIVPGCYGGRYPHCHFEVFASVADAVGGGAPLLVSQLAFPEAECRALYRSDARYGESLRNLDALPIERDFVFNDAPPEVLAAQTIELRGDAETGYRGTATVALG